jgi:hypothetical protein
LAELRRFKYPLQQLAFEELKHAIDRIEVHVATLDKTIKEATVNWYFRPNLRGGECNASIAVGLFVGIIQISSGERAVDELEAGLRDIATGQMDLGRMDLSRLIRQRDNAPTIENFAPISAIAFCSQTRFPAELMWWQPDG